MPKKKASVKQKKLSTKPKKPSKKKAAKWKPMARKRGKKNKIEDRIEIGWVFC